MTIVVLNIMIVYTYLLTKISPDESPDVNLQNSESTYDVSWTDSKNALIELVYALYASGAISHGKIYIPKNQPDISDSLSRSFRRPISRFPSHENPHRF